MKKITLFICFFLLTSATAFADAANIGGQGNTLQLMDSEDIEMVYEHIQANVYQSPYDMDVIDWDSPEARKAEGYIKFDVTYTFKNTTDQELTVQMGFPEFCGYGCAEGSDWYDDANFYALQYKLWDFMAYDDSEKLGLTFQSSIDADTDGTNWYVFEVTFAPNEQKDIRNMYWVSPSAYRSGMRWLDYTLETGSTWKNSIGELDIEIIFEDDLSIYDVTEIHPEDFTYNFTNNSVEWHLTDLEPTTADNLNISYDDPSVEEFSCEIAYEDDEYLSDYLGDASSFLQSDPDNDLYYYPCKAYDNNTSTAWVEGAEGAGIGEWFQMNLDSTKVYQEVKIFNGYGSSEDIWEKNNRIKQLKISYSNGLKETIDLLDYYGNHEIALDNKAMGVEWAKIEIVDVYEGTTYKDTALTEIKFLGLIAAEPNFPDISGHKYEYAISFIKNRGIVHGYPDGTFQPDNTINRAELTKIIIQAVYPGQAVGTDCFPDVAEQWFAPFVCFAKENGIIDGYPDGTFKPELEINYVEALKIVLEAFGNALEEETDPWYQGYLDMAGNMKVGVADTENDENITRGKMAELITRMLKYNEEGPESDYLN